MLGAKITVYFGEFLYPSAYGLFARILARYIDKLKIISHSVLAYAA